jgi:multidrug efflux pump subunit AcrB
MSSGQVLEKIEKVAKEVLPSDFSFDWSGASLQEKRSGGTSVIALVAGAFMAFLILAAQYERWSLPLSVMLALPFGTFGALAAIWIHNLVFGTLFHKRRSRTTCTSRSAS